MYHELRVVKCQSIKIVSMPVTITSKYWKIPSNTGKLNVLPWNFLQNIGKTFIRIISIIEAKKKLTQYFNILVYQLNYHSLLL